MHKTQFLKIHETKYGLMSHFTTILESIVYAHATSSAWDRDRTGWKVAWKRILYTVVFLYTLSAPLLELSIAIMMNMKRVVVLSKSVQLGKQLLVCHARNARKDVAQVYQQRSIKTHSRNLAYAKDLFLGQVNKVNERIHLEHRHE